MKRYEADASKILSYLNISGKITIIPTITRVQYRFIARIDTEESSYILKCNEHRMFILGNFEMLQYLQSLEVAPKPILYGTHNELTFSLEEYIPHKKFFMDSEEKNPKDLVAIIKKFETLDTSQVPESTITNHNFAMSSNSLFNFLKKHHSKNLLNTIFNNINVPALLDVDQFLCHGDLKADNTLVTEKGLFLIDFENSMLGPKGFDFGHFLFTQEAPLQAFKYFADLTGVHEKTLIFYTGIRGLQKTTILNLPPSLVQKYMQRALHYLQFLIPDCDLI